LGDLQPYASYEHSGALTAAEPGEVWVVTLLL